MLATPSSASAATASLWNSRQMLHTDGKTVSREIWIYICIYICFTALTPPISPKPSQSKRNCSDVNCAEVSMCECSQIDGLKSKVLNVWNWRKNSGFYHEHAESNMDFNRSVWAVRLAQRLTTFPHCADFRLAARQWFPARWIGCFSPGALIHFLLTMIYFMDVPPWWPHVAIDGFPSFISPRTTNTCLL